MSSIARGIVTLLAVAVVVTGCATQTAQRESVKDAARTKPSFAMWLKDYIPAQYPGETVDDHGEWFQAKMRSGWVSWADLVAEDHKGVTLKGVSGVREGKSLFVATDKKETWGDSPAVVYYESVGYYIPEYSAATMANWPMYERTLVQFDGDGKKFSEAMAKAWIKAQKS